MPTLLAIAVSRLIASVGYLPSFLEMHELAIFPADLKVLSLTLQKNLQLQFL
jgi:hypothetical protein